MAEKLSKNDTALQEALDKRGTQPVEKQVPTQQDENAQSSRKLQETLNAKQVDTSTAKQARLHDKAQQLTSEEGEGEKLQAPAENESRDIGGTIAQTAQNVQQNVQDKLTPVANKISSMRTVGGLGLLFTILFILLIAIVRVNSSGDTRLKQWWYMLNGRATLQGHTVPTASQGATGSSANFGTTTGTSTTPTTNSTNSSGTTFGGAFGVIPDGFTSNSPYRSNGSF